MGDTSIEWTDKTWNPVRGCSRVSEGCRNCYAERQAARFCAPEVGPFFGYVARTQSGPRWTGLVELIEDHLADPLRWKKPQRVFVNSMSDLFHEGLDDEAISAVFAVMSQSPQHTFQILTKRPKRMLEWFSRSFVEDGVEEAGVTRFPWCHANTDARWPLPNVWLGVSVEDQKTADERIPLLLQTPAAVRFVSYEPALGPVDFGRWLAFLDWIIVGGESGPSARPMHPDWARVARDQCLASETAFFFKQWGEHGPSLTRSPYTLRSPRGKKANGRILDGREWNQFPKTANGVHA